MATTAAVTPPPVPITSTTADAIYKIVPREDGGALLYTVFARMVDRDIRDKRGERSTLRAVSEATLLPTFLKNIGAIVETGFDLRWHVNREIEILATLGRDPVDLLLKADESNAFELGRTTAPIVLARALHILWPHITDDNRRVFLLMFAAGLKLEASDVTDSMDVETLINIPKVDLNRLFELVFYRTRYTRFPTTFVKCILDNPRLFDALKSALLEDVWEGRNDVFVRLLCVLEPQKRIEFLIKLSETAREDLKKYVDLMLKVFQMNVLPSDRRAYILRLAKELQLTVGEGTMIFGYDYLTPLAPTRTPHIVGDCQLWFGKGSDDQEHWFSCCRGGSIQWQMPLEVTGEVKFLGNCEGKVIISLGPGRIVVLDAQTGEIAHSKLTPGGTLYIRDFRRTQLIIGHIKDGEWTLEKDCVSTAQPLGILEEALVSLVGEREVQLLTPAGLGMPLVEFNPPEGVKVFPIKFTEGIPQAVAGAPRQIRLFPGFTSFAGCVDGVVFIAKLSTDKRSCERLAIINPGATSALYPLRDTRQDGFFRSTDGVVWQYMPGMNAPVRIREVARLGGSDD